jgi:hypothetical protein
MCKEERVQLLHEREMKTRESARVQRDNQTVEAKHHGGVPSPMLASWSRTRLLYWI